MNPLFTDTYHKKTVRLLDAQSSHKCGPPVRLVMHSQGPETRVSSTLFHAVRFRAIPERTYKNLINQSIPPDF